MELFKNGVGRPSNETLNKRRNFKIILVVVIALVLVGVSFATYKILSNNIKGKGKEASVACNYQFSQSKCNWQRNATVKAIQQKLWNLGYYKGIYTYKSSAVDGIFGSKTTKALKKFQKAKNLSQDGIVGPATFDALFSDQKYYTIQYPKGNFSMDSTDANHQQKILNGVAQKISTTKINKSGYNHVGWEVTTTLNGQNYVVGCLNNRDCRKGAKSYVYSYVDKKTGYFKTKDGKTIYPAIYGFGTSVSQTGWIHKQVFNFNPKYCASGYYYNSANSTCTKNAASSSASTTTSSSNTKPFYTSGVNWIVPKKYNYKNVKNAIGVQTDNNCLDFAEAYAVYILGATGDYGEKGSTKVSNRNAIGHCDWTTYYGATNHEKNKTPGYMYKAIVREINAGRPVVLYTPRKINSTTWRDHWVLIVGYKKGITSIGEYDQTAFKNNILILDPADCSNKILAKSYLITDGYKGYLNPFGDSSGNGGWETYKLNNLGVFWTWPSADKARACK